MQCFVPVFSSELAGHVNDPRGLGLADLSLTRGKYKVTVGMWGTIGGWVTAGRVDGPGCHLTLSSKGFSAPRKLQSWVAQ